MLESPPFKCIGQNLKPFIIFKGINRLTFYKPKNTNTNETERKFFKLFAYLLPAVVTGMVAFYFFRLHTRNEEGRRRYLLHKDSQKDTFAH